MNLEINLYPKVEIGQIWGGNARVAFRKVRVVKIGDQPKRKRITYAFLDEGYTFTDYESVFRSNYGLLRQEALNGR